MESHNFERLKAHILPLSVSLAFDVARSEWVLEAVEISEEFDNCPCGQEIKEHCYIRNRMNGNATYVGNVCINRFIQIDTGNLFDGLKRIAADNTANPNHDLIEHAWEKGYLFGGSSRFVTRTALSRTDYEPIECRLPGASSRRESTPSCRSPHPLADTSE